MNHKRVKKPNKIFYIGLFIFILFFAVLFIFYPFTRESYNSDNEKTVILISHLGMGDNFYMSGALTFLSKYYKSVKLVVKENNYNNIKISLDRDNIECVPVNTDDERKTLGDLVDKYRPDPNVDIILCGLYKMFGPSKITNKKVIQDMKNISETPTQSLNLSMITDDNYAFIHEFYKDIGLNIDYFFNGWYINISKNSIDKYKSISGYYLIFIQLKSSEGMTLNITNLLSKYKNKPDVLIVCNDYNHYDKEDTKYQLAQQYIYANFPDYYHLIANANEIFIIDSCFVGIVLPMYKKGLLKAKTVEIILRGADIVL